MFLLSEIDDDPSENRVWNDSLDGRAIHSFLLWSEPASERAVRAALGEDSTLAGSAVLQPVDRARPALQALQGGLDLAGDGTQGPAGTVTPQGGPPIAVLEDCGRPGDAPRLRPAGQPLRDAVLDALRVLSRARLRYVTDLGVGAVVLGGDTHPLPQTPEIIWLPQPAGSPLADAEQLLRAGARAWAGQWLRAEHEAGIRTAPPADEDRAWVAGLLADCFAHQLHDRLATEHPGHQECAERAGTLLAELRELRDTLPERLGRITGFGIVTELVSFMYPVWNRRQFGVKSPFDYMRRLRPFTQAEREGHHARWVAGATR